MFAKKVDVQAFYTSTIVDYEFELFERQQLFINCLDIT
jgi:hypothetical protein